MGKTRKREIGPKYNDNDKFHNEWNDHRLPQAEFRKAIVGIKESLRAALGTDGAVQKLCEEIKTLPSWELPEIGLESEAVGKLFARYPKKIELEINGLILLLNPGALPGEQYPQNIEDFAKAFHVQEESFGYLGPDTSVAEQVKWIACDVLGTSYEPPSDIN